MKNCDSISRRGRGRATTLLVVVTLATGVAYPAEPPSDRHAFAERHMGTLFQVTVIGDATAARAAANRAFARAAELDAMLSDYKPESELSRLSNRSGQGPVRVSPELFLLLRHARELSHRSDGAFDVTVGPMVRLWRLARRTRELPPPAELADARSRVGFDKLVLDERASTAELTAAGMKLDLGGIAKGYAADEMIRVLREAGFRHALVAAGGDVVAGDPPPGHSGWSVSVASPDPDARPRVLSLANAAASTCGDAEQAVEIGGQRYSHVLDPRTGLGLKQRRAVTVIAANGLTADGLDTAAAVLGPDRGIQLIRRTPHVSAIYTWLEGDRWMVREHVGR